MEESTGKLIMDLMEIHSENILVPYARKWIKLFPLVESAPRLTGKWLQNYGSNDAMYLATSYVKTYPDVKALILILRAVAKMPQLPSRLFAAIERRFLAEPNSHVWAALQANGYQNPEIHKLLVRWLEINRSNTNIEVDVAYVALFTDSPEVLDEVMRWTQFNHLKAKSSWIVFTNLFRGNSQAHRDIAPRVAELARIWLSKNADSDDYGRVVGDLLTNMQSAEDLREAKAWYHQYSKSKSAYMAVAGILDSMHSRGDEPDLEFVSQAKLELRKQSPEERVPVLAGALLRACRDEESIALAKETCRCNQFLTWLHAELVQISPDSELIERANKIMSAGSSGLPDLIIEMLKIDNTNLVAVKAAERWMRNYSEHEQVKAIKSLLPTAQKPKRTGVQSKRKA